MPSVLPGPPTSIEPSRAFSRAIRHGRQFLAYISSTSLFIFLDNVRLVQVIESPFEQAQIELVTFDRRLGGIAISCGTEVKIYEETVDYSPTNTASPHLGNLDISWKLSTQTEVTGCSITSLSWGLNKELLIANDHLLLYHPSSSSYRTNELVRTWIFAQSKSIAYAQFSPDANLIASYSKDDTLVKIWRRLSDRVTSTGIKTSDFDFDYLVHPRSVTGVKWRQPFHEDLVVDNILYSTCLDGVLRIWASDIPHDSHILTLHESLNLKSSGRISKIGVILDDDVFSSALLKSTKNVASDKEKKELLKLFSGISNSQTELALIFGFDQTMHAHALHNLGSRSHKPSSQNLFYKVDKTNLLEQHLSGSNIWMAADVQRIGPSDLTFFMATEHQIEVHEVKLVDLFSHSKAQNAFHKVFTFCGHKEAICDFAIQSNGSVQSRDRDSQVCLWDASNDTLEPWTGPASSNDESTPQLPGYVHTLNETPSKIAVSTDLSATVVADRLDQIQIWGNELITSFSGSPLSVLTCNAEVVQVQWSKTGTVPFLVACTAHEIYAFGPCREREPWECIWSYDFTKITPGIITGIAMIADTVLAVTVGCCIYTFNESDWHMSLSVKMLQITEERPIYDPTYLRQILVAGNLNGARRILSALHDQLVKSTSVTDITNDLGLTFQQIFAHEQNVPQQASKARQDYSAIFGTSAIETDTSLLPASKSSSLQSMLQQFELPNVTESQQKIISAIAQTLVMVEPEESSLDAMGLRFYVSYCILGQLKSAENQVVELTSEDITWARRSMKQDILVNLVKASVKNLTWDVARGSKIFYWLRDQSALLEIAENIAKAEFLKGDDRDPVAASIWYLAMQKKTVLLGLWRISGVHPEHNLTTKILGNDFDQPKWRTAANKNAFALIGRRRFEYAAAWFLLGGSLKDAVSVCVRNVQDLDLALAIARIYEDGKGVLEALISDNIMQHAQQTGDKFLAWLCQDLQGNDKSSADILMNPLGTNCLDTPELLFLYEDLRLSYGAHQQERNFITYICSLLQQRGCPKVAAQIEQSWRYESPADSAQQRTTVPETSLEEFKAKNKTRLASAPSAAFDEPSMDSFAAFDF